MDSELRQDLVSGDWVAVAPSRLKRPEEFKRREKRKKAPLKNCPFENPQDGALGEPILVHTDPKTGKWTLQIVPNKYPAFTHKDVCPALIKHGPFFVVGGAGHHDIVITRDHNKNFSHLSFSAANRVFQAFRDRYLMLFNDKCLAYISIFHNWGPKAGASIYHPHYQMIAIPVIPPDVEHSVRGSRRWFKKHKTCVHCKMIEWEKKEKTRVIYENKGAIAFTPFVSREPFEVRILPKKHLPYFENTLDEDIEFIVDALQKSIQLLRKSLKDPDYNFFIHTAPLRKKENYKHYHWHIEILPKVDISAGFELGTGIEINPVDPDFAAKILKNHRFSKK